MEEWPHLIQMRPFQFELFDSGLSEAQKENRRQEILAAAQRCFARNGFHSTTIADIVRESGVCQGTFYVYFKT